MVELKIFPKVSYLAKVINKDAKGSKIGLYGRSDINVSLGFGTLPN